ncbi:U-box domain-containing protein 27-like [Zingiber officinale]|nr:U-box domain-containing protein 27-like [Zingiber officinale]
MGRKEERPGQALEVKVPNLFRCPISLDVMRSPVSLCTGVTYDRASIQRWLESGNTTCPATMLPLPSTDLIPNLTVQRLIHIWSASASAAASASSPSAVLTRRVASDLLREINSSAADHDTVPALRKLADFFSSVEVDEIDKNDLVNAGGCPTVLAPLLLRKDSKLEVSAAVARVLALILTSDVVTEGNKKIVVSTLVSDLHRSISALVRLLRDEERIESRIDAAWVLDAIVAAAASDAEAKMLIAENEEMIGELVRLIEPADEKGTAMDCRAVEAGLGCLDGISSAKRARPRMVRLGIVEVLTRVLGADPAVSTPVAAGKALRIMEAVAGCAEGRAAICEEGAAAVSAVVRRMVKTGREGAEAAVAVLWSVCHAFRDRRAAEALAAAEGGATKLLLVMQSGCSPAARQMAADLLKISRVNSKSCLAGYDTKTTHITPF